MNSDDLRQAIFGMNDGIVSILGILIPGIVLTGHISHLPILVTGLAITAGISMGGAEFESDNSLNVKGALVMAFFSFFGTLFPAIPLFFGINPLTIAISVLFVLGVSWYIAHGKSSIIGKQKAYTIVFGILSVATLLTVLFSLAFGVS
jgi:VIT1/CCC1 family predicted Fe2+/Mn2+ transporter